MLFFSVLVSQRIESRWYKIFRHWSRRNILITLASSSEQQCLPSEYRQTVFSSRVRRGSHRSARVSLSIDWLIRNRPPTSGAERSKGSNSTLIELNRPTTAPVVVEGGGMRRMTSNKAKSAAPMRPPPPRAPPAPLRAARSIDASGNFDNLTGASFLHLTDGLKPSIFKADNHFVHQLCSNPTADNGTDILSTSRDSFLDLSNGTLAIETTTDRDHEQQQEQQSAESTEDELEDVKVTIFSCWSSWRTILFVIA